MSSKQTLVFITASYPYGKGETFLHEELPYLAKAFDKIHIIPYFIPKDDEQRTIPENCQVETFYAQREMVGEADSKLFEKGLNKKMLLSELKRTSWLWFFKNFTALRKLASTAIFEAGILSAWINKNVTGNYKVYSFWFAESATAVAVLRAQKIIPYWCSRVLGYDLFDERHELGKQPFRSFKIDKIDKMSTICKAGTVYLHQKVKSADHHKINTRYFGVNIPNKRVGAYQGGKFTLMSCANVIPLKRIHLILEILKEIKFSIQWFHLGDGPLLKELKEKSKSLPANVEVTFMGRMNNEEIADFYIEKNANLFIHVSETEGGAPVAIMDAMSCGIPFIGASAGGVTEMFTPDVGKLLPLNFETSEAVDFMNKMQQQVIVFDPEKVQSDCNARFNSQENFTKYAKELAG